MFASFLTALHRPTSPRPHQGSRKRSGHFLLAIVFAGSGTLLGACHKETADGFPGYAEGEYVRLAAPLAGYLSRIDIKAGDTVRQNQSAFVLEQVSEHAAHDEASARVQEAQDKLENLRKSKRPDEIKAVEAQLAQATATLAFDHTELVRQKKLVAEKFVSASRLDEIQAAVDRDTARINELRAQLHLSHEGARSDEIRAAEHDLEAARAQLAQADWKLDQKTQRIPTDAIVNDVYYRPGEWVAAGSPIISLLPPANIKARFFIPETQLGQVALGQSVTLQCDGCSAPVAARISYIAQQAEYTSPLIYSKENRASLVFMVEARPDPKDAVRLHPGQPLQIRLNAPRS